MSTSNIKNPLVVRTGFLDDWKVRPTLNYELENKVIWELRKVNAALVSITLSSKGCLIIYYKWIQRPFLSFNLRKVKKKYSTAKRLMGRGGNNQVWLSFFKRKRVNYIEKLRAIYTSSCNYLPPHSLQLKIGKIHGITDITLMNVFLHTYNIKAPLINFIDFVAKTNQLRRWNQLKFNFDMIVLYNFLMAEIATVKVLVEGISLALARNSKKGSQRSLLKYLEKLPALIKSFAHKDKNRVTLAHSFNNEKLLVIVVQGKFAVTGRTQVLRIQPKQLPLHTLSTIFDYSEGFSNTKAGTFSIKVWRIKQ